MFWIDPQGNQYDATPLRVRLPDSTTRTSEAVTDELLYELGWAKIDDSQVVQDVAEPVPDTVIVDSIGGA